MGATSPIPASRRRPPVLAPPPSRAARLRAALARAWAALADWAALVWLGRAGRLDRLLARAQWAAPACCPQ